jgi:hypothetical protein
MARPITATYEFDPLQRFSARRGGGGKAGHPLASGRIFTAEDAGVAQENPSQNLRDRGSSASLGFLRGDDGR